MLQIRRDNSRPLRLEKIDIEVIKHLIQESHWKRQCGMKKEVDRKNETKQTSIVTSLYFQICVFCRHNGEHELIYSSHSLKDSIGNVTSPILRAYQCPICAATGSQGAYCFLFPVYINNKVCFFEAHTIKYCQATGDDSIRHIPTP